MNLCFSLVTTDIKVCGEVRSKNQRISSLCIRWRWAAIFTLWLSGRRMEGTCSDFYRGFGYLTTLSLSKLYSTGRWANRRMGQYLERSNGRLFEVLSQHFPGRTEESHENVSQDRRCPCQDSNRAPPKYNSRDICTVTPTVIVREIPSFPEVRANFLLIG